MIESADADFHIDLPSSWMVGDKNPDAETGTRGGTRTAFVLTGYGRQHKGLLEHEPDLIEENLLDVAEHITDLKRA